MPDRSRVVEMMLTAARLIAANEAFAEEAMWCAEMVEGQENCDGAKALRAMVVARRSEAALMREIMEHLAVELAMMPLEAA